MMNEKLEKAFNDQINKEFYSELKKLIQEE